MSEEFQLALSLLLIGMITVFVILTLVVAGGRLLVTVSNRFIRAEETEVASSAEDEEIPVAIISAVVHHITKGKGRISGIRKMD